MKNHESYTSIAQRLLTPLDRLIDKQFSASEAAPLKIFARQFYASTSERTLKEVSAQILLAALLEAWEVMLERNKSKPLIVMHSHSAIDTAANKTGGGEDGKKGSDSHGAHKNYGSYTNLYVLMDDKPFIVDSLCHALNQLSVPIKRVRNAVVHVKRSTGQTGKLLELSAKPAAEFHNESFCLIRVAGISLKRQKAVSRELNEVLRHVSVAVRDFTAMTNKAKDLAEQLITRGKPPVLQQERNDPREFLLWLVDNNFTFLGYDEYEIRHSKSGVSATPRAGSQLGVAPFDQPFKGRVSLSQLPEGMRGFALDKRLIDFVKSPTRSKVHRSVYYDYVVLREFDEQGRVVAYYRFIGLYTSTVFFRDSLEIPLLRRKVQRVLDRSGFTRGGHSSKDLLQVINLYPRDELFLISADELLHTSVEITRIQDTSTVRLFIRRDNYGKFFSCLVFVPRDNYSTDVRMMIRQFLEEHLHAKEEVFNTYMSESVLVRIHFVLQSSVMHQVKYNPKELERALTALIQPWSEKFFQALQDRHGDIKAQEMLESYGNCFPAGYRDYYSAEEAVADIERVRRVESSGELELDLSRSGNKGSSKDSAELVFKIFARDAQLHLSDVDPILENLGLKIISETTFPLQGGSGCKVWLHEFLLYREQLTEKQRGGSKSEPLKKPVMRGFEEAFRAVWQRRIDDDRFNALVISAALNWREAALLRAYAAYLKQLQIGYRPEFVADTLITHSRISRRLVEYFHALLEPSEVEKTKRPETLRKQIVRSIDKVVNLSQDGVLRMMLNLIDATMRTNYFQPAEQGGPKDYFAFKFNPHAISNMPLPKPRFEIFVYARSMEGVHLRGGLVARGGLRWSDRSEDYRTEVLGLVKAQQVKNAVIVPVGAKGCFVVKRQAQADNRETRQHWQEQGVAAYQTFINGLLDLTDNLFSGKVVPPPAVLRRDEDDPYLVVAADKGTATFSDIANDIAARYKFWLGDGFASGGSNGYDHKAMGITARGAWISARRHFRELGINPQKEDFTVTGIGDMSGDVFGNGMLLSRHIRLLAAFNHQHIFIDPNPDAATTFRERRRLFKLPRSAWTDFNPALISKGGGVFERQAKSIPISRQMRERFRIDAKTLTPDQLIRAILVAPVDLLWNGGIGTYVKAGHESHFDIGDKANDSLRVDASALRCRIVCEGGNLGLSQAARIEYGLGGGISITDFIDNAAGVDCSDHEVNIKILLNGEVVKKRLSLTKRNTMLEAMTDEVTRLVLSNNYQQVLSISLAHAERAGRAREYAELITYLEQHGGLNRTLEMLPGRDEMEERIAKQLFLTRPEIAVLSSYTKMFLKLELPEADYIDDPCLDSYLFSEFPAPLVKNYQKAIRKHPLRHEIIATRLANSLVNLTGPSFFYRMARSTGSSLAEVTRMALISREVFNVDTFWTQAEDLGFSVSGETQTRIMLHLARLVRRATRWLLRNRRHRIHFKDIPALRKDIEAVRNMLPEKLPQDVAANFIKKRDKLIAEGVPKAQAHQFVICDYIPSSITFVELSHSNKITLAETVDYFYGVGEALSLHWLLRVLNQLPVNNYWQALARESYLDELAGLQRNLCRNIINETHPQPAATGIAHWIQQHDKETARAQQLINQLQAESQQDYAMYAVTLRELSRLVAATKQS